MMLKRLAGGRRCTHLGNPSCLHRLERVCLFWTMFFPTEMRSPALKIFSGKLEPWLDFLEACVLATWSNSKNLFERVSLALAQASKVTVSL